MTKQEYLQTKKDRVHALDLKSLRLAYITLDEVASKYFQAWQSAEQRVKELEITLSVLTNKLDNK